MLMLVNISMFVYISDYQSMELDAHFGGLHLHWQKGDYGKGIRRGTMSNRSLTGDYKMEM